MDTHATPIGGSVLGYLAHGGDLDQGEQAAIQATLNLIRTNVESKLPKPPRGMHYEHRTRITAEQGGLYPRIDFTDEVTIRPGHPLI